MPVTTCVRGMKGVEKDVYLSMPAAIGATGVVRVIDLPLTEQENEKFLHSADAIWKIQKDIWDKIE